MSLSSDTLLSFLDLCSTWLQLRPNFCDAWSNLASAYMRKGRLDEAAQCCRQALALNPRLVGFYLVWLDYRNDVLAVLSSGPRFHAILHSMISAI